jgi:hypothetical protein
LHLVGFFFMNLWINKQRFINCLHSIAWNGRKVTEWSCGYEDVGPSSSWLTPNMKPLDGFWLNSALGLFWTKIEYVPFQLVLDHSYSTWSLHVTWMICSLVVNLRTVTNIKVTNSKERNLSWLPTSLPVSQRHLQYFTSTKEYYRVHKRPTSPYMKPDKSINDLKLWRRLNAIKATRATRYVSSSTTTAEMALETLLYSYFNNLTQLVSGVLLQMNPVHIFPSYFSKINFNIIFQPTPRLY